MALEDDPVLREYATAQAFLGEVYPDAILIAPAEEGDIRLERLHEAGLGLAHAIFADGSSQETTYIRWTTPYTEALAQIWFRELSEEIPPGSHDRAVDGIISGDFHHEWGAYL